MQAAPILVHLIFDQAFNQGNLAIVDELVLVDVTTHLASWGVPASRLGIKQLIANLRSAFPDLHITVVDEIGQRDKSAVLWTMRGTHKGSFFGNLPTGRPVEVQGTIFTRIENGRIIECWILIDQMGMLQQLGMVPPPRGSF
jgi:predicted ester cyclase